MCEKCVARDLRKSAKARREAKGFKKVVRTLDWIVGRVLLDGLVGRQYVGTRIMQTMGMHVLCLCLWFVLGGLLRQHLGIRDAAFAGLSLAGFWVMYRFVLAPAAKRAAGKNAEREARETVNELRAMLVAMRDAEQAGFERDPLDTARFN